MNKPTKKQFYSYMSHIYGKYEDTNGYKTLIEILNKAHDPYIYGELSEMIDFSEQDRLGYRYALACHGKELTPTQVDQHISIIEYALEFIHI
jgi:hypothetical protein